MKLNGGNLAVRRAGQPFKLAQRGNFELLDRIGRIHFLEAENRERARNDRVAWNCFKQNAPFMLGRVAAATMVYLYSRVNVYS